MNRRRQPGRLWRTLAEAPYLPIVAYLGLVGIVGIVTGAGVAPHPLRALLPTWLVMAWTVGIAAGGTLATLGAFLRNGTRAESAGLGLLAYGAALYGAVVASVAWPHALTVIAVSVAVLSMCLIRLRVLSLARRAQRRAGQITRRRGR